MAEFKIEGLNEVLKSLEKTLNSEETLGKACALLEAATIKKAPKDKGTLKRSIESKIEGNQGFVFSNLEYAPYVEYGTGIFAENGGRQSAWRYQDEQGEWHTTSGMKPQPFMRPALEESKEAILKIFIEGINK